MRLVIQPRPTDAGGRGMLEEVFLDRILVEPGDSAQPPGDGRAGPALDFEFPGEAFDVGAADGEQGQRAGAALRGELTQVQGVGLACQTAIPGQEPGKSEPFRISEGRLDLTSAVEGTAVVIGHLPAGLEPGRLGRFRSQWLSGNPT